MNRSIRRLYLALAGGFALLMGMLGYWQVIAAGGLNDRADNPYTAQRQRLTDRGRIISRDDVVLAESREVRRNGRAEYVRVYPRDDLTAHVVGYATPDHGSTGLEARYNRFLAGSYGTEPLLQRLRLRDKKGADVYLTIDTRVQEAAVLALGGRPGAVVAIDPRNGAIRAIASAPSYNPNAVATSFDAIRQEEGGPLLDRATAGGYPPGSTFKVVTSAAALGSGLYTPDSTFDDTGVFIVNGQKITNSGNAKYGFHNLTEALTRSINTTFAGIGQRLGDDRMGAALSAFRFGRDPGVDLPRGEVLTSGRYRNGKLLPNRDRTADSARIAIGQENLLVTPLQMAMVAAGIADGGQMYRPYLVRKVVDRGGTVVRVTKPRPLPRAADPAVAAEVNAMMQQVVEEGTGTAAALEGLQVAGKTGTAETDDPSRNQAWFIGFAPADAPTIAVAVVIENTPETGGDAAAPVAADVMRAAIAAQESP